MHDDRVPTRTGCIVADRLLVLDRRASRYFSVPHDIGTSTPIPDPPAYQAELLSWTHERSTRRDNARITWVTRAQTAVSPSSAPTHPGALFKLWREERTAGRQLRAGIDAGLALLASADCHGENSRRQQELIAASWRSRQLWSAENRCLPRSIALARALREAGSTAKLVLGVMGQPFAAHAWVQDAEIVLNDTIDHVTLFAPILVA